VRLVYMGTPELSVVPLRALVAAGHDVQLVVTQADKRRSRGAGLDESPVKQAALELGLPVSHRVADVLDVEADLGVVVAFGRLIKPDVLAHMQMINMHFSLLPRWRGAAPVERAVLAGDPVTGVDIMALEESLDTGAIYARAELPISDDDYLEDLRSRLVDVGTELLLSQLSGPLATPTPQVGEPTYASKLDDADFQIDGSLDAIDAHRRVRLHRAYCAIGDQRLRIHRATIASEAVSAVPAGHVGRATIDGAHVIVLTCADDRALVLDQIQPAGKPRMEALAWWNGLRQSSPVALASLLA
jgi:methionyl-tRNA formyltransferase